MIVKIGNCKAKLQEDFNKKFMNNGINWLTDAHNILISKFSKLKKHICQEATYGWYTNKVDENIWHKNLNLSWHLDGFSQDTKSIIMASLPTATVFLDTKTNHPFTYKNVTTKGVKEINKFVKILLNHKLAKVKKFKSGDIILMSPKTLHKSPNWGSLRRPRYVMRVPLTIYPSQVIRLLGK